MENSKSNSKNRKFQTLVKTNEYWEEKFKTDLFNSIFDYLEQNNISQTELANKVGCSRGYISQVLNGDCDHRLSKIIGLSLAIGKAPYLYLRDMNLVERDANIESSVHIDFEELEDSTFYCDLIESESEERLTIGWTDFLEKDSLLTSRDLYNFFEENLHANLNEKNIEPYSNSEGRVYQVDKKKSLAHAV